MTQPTHPDRKTPVFLPCPICGTEFRGNRSQQWCSLECVWVARRAAGSAPPGRLVLTPEGRFRTMASAARHHNINRVTVWRRIRNGLPGWQFEAPYQIPADFVPSGTPWRKREDRT
jgi:hypothetical protein